MSEADQDQPADGLPHDEDGDQRMVIMIEIINNDDDQLHEIKQSDEAAERAQRFQALCDEVQLAPAFEEQELGELTVAQLKIIANYWGITVRSSMRKNTLISTISNHENNQDPEWVSHFSDNNVLLPPYHKNELKKHKVGDLKDIASEWGIPDFAGMNRVELMAKILEHSNNFINYRPNDYEHPNLGSDDVAWSTDAEPPSEPEIEDTSY